jgi:hypothetical protein
MDGLKSNPENSLFDEEMLRELLDYEVTSEPLFSPALPKADLEGQEPVPLPEPAPAKSKHRKVSYKSANLQDKRLIQEAKRLEGLRVEERLSLQTHSAAAGVSEDTKSSAEMAEALAACPPGVKRVAVAEIKNRVAAIEESISLAKSVLSKLMTPPK